MVTAILAIASVLLIIAAVALFAWTYGDYIVSAWNWVLEAFQALLSGVPGWAVAFFAAALFIAFLAILVKLL